MSSKQSPNKKKASSKKEPNKKKRSPKKRTVKERTLSKARKRKKKFFGFVWNLLFYVVMAMILSGSLLMAVMQKQDKSLNGYRMFGVLTNSMVSPGNTIKAGGFRAGDLLMIKEESKEKIKVDDVITYRPSTDPDNKNTNYLTHRVVKIKDRLGDEKGLFFITRGDANKTDDMPISADALVGKVVVRVPKIGGILSFIKENWLISLIFILSILGFIWVMRIYVLSAPVSKKRTHKKKKPITKKKKRAPIKYGITSFEVNINKKISSRRKQK